MKLQFQILSRLDEIPNIFRWIIDLNVKDKPQTLKGNNKCLLKPLVAEGFLNTSEKFLTSKD